MRFGKEHSILGCMDLLGLNNLEPLYCLFNEKRSKSKLIEDLGIGVSNLHEFCLVEL